MAQATNNAIEKRQKSETVNVPERIEQQETAYTYTPLVDVLENDDAFVFEADLPGVKPGDLDVSFERGTLSIAAKAHPRQPAGQRYLWREYGVGNFYRSFSIETPVDADGIRADLKNGVLSVYVPKAASAKPKKIEVRTA